MTATPTTRVRARKRANTRASDDSNCSRRLSTGPLSAHTMSQIRCPTRVDFLNAVNGVASCAPSYGSANALARARSHPRSIRNANNASIASSSCTDVHLKTSAERRRSRTPRVTLRTSRLTDEVAESGSTSSPAVLCEIAGRSLQSSDVPVSPTSHDDDDDVIVDAEQNQIGSCDKSASDGQIVWCFDSDKGKSDDDEEEEGVPEYLNELVLDAMDVISECDELKAIVEWMDLVRKEQGFRRALTDIDLTNGIAMLQVLSTVADEAFRGESEEARAIELVLDQGGQAAKNNIVQLREALRRFPWKDGPEGAPLQAVPFERVEIWGLAGFVLLAALTGGRCDVEERRILNMEKWMQDRLSDVLASGLEALGAGSSTCQNKDDYRGSEDERQGGWFAERKKRKELEEQVERLSALVEELTEERDQLVVDLVAERRQAEQARTELRWLKAAIGRRRKVLGETNNDVQLVCDEEEFKDVKVVEASGDEEIETGLK